MDIVIYEEDSRQRSHLKNIIQKAAPPKSDVADFNNSDVLLEYIDKKDSSVAFISLEDERGRGYLLARKVKERFPRTNLIFLSRNQLYMKEALKLRYSGYISSPTITKEIIQDELNNLRYL